MSRNHFNKLSKQIHLNNNANQVPHENPAYDKLFKVRLVHDRIVQCCKMELRPHRHLSVDEAMIKFKGRLGMKQYTCMLMKPVKRVIKVAVFTKHQMTLCVISKFTWEVTRWHEEAELGLSCCSQLKRA